MLLGRSVVPCARCLAVLTRGDAARRGLRVSAALRWQEYDNNRWFDKGEDIWGRSIYNLTYDWRRAKRRYLQAKYDEYNRRGLLSHTKREAMQYEMLPFEAEFVIVGGGIIGTSIAYWIKQRTRDEDARVVIIEDDNTFSKSATVLAAGGIRQQFSIPENVEMSLFGAEFLRNAGHHLQILDNDPPDIDFLPMGYLFLATTNDSSKVMEENWKMQTSLGAKVALLNQDELRARFPFMNFDDIVLGSFGLEDEGAIDPWQLLSAMREKNLTLGVQYVKARVDGLYFEEDPQVRTPLTPAPDGHERDLWKRQVVRGVYMTPQKTDAAPRPIRAMCVVNAAGPWAGELARTAGIGQGEGLLRVPVPIAPRKRYVYVLHCPDGPGLDMPFLIDPSGVWCRREHCGHTYLCGKSPDSEEEDLKIDHSNLDVDYEYFYETIWPVLAARIPAFERLKVKSAWAGYYDYNYFDQNPIIGGHLLWGNFHHVCGFSGHGLQHAIAAGRGFMEFWQDGAYTTINMRKFDFRRLLKKSPLLETGII